MLSIPYEEEYRGYRIQIVYDEMMEDPRCNDNLGSMVCFHRRYVLGDDMDINPDDFPTIHDLYNYLVNECGAVVIKPLYLYDHSGLAMSTSGFASKWDSGQVGFIYATKSDILDFYSKTRVTGFTKKARYLTKRLRAAAEECLEAEVKEYDQFLRGEVYEYLVYDEGNNLVHWCGGYIGAAEDALGDAKAEVDAIIRGPMTQTELNFGG